MVELAIGVVPANHWSYGSIWRCTMWIQNDSCMCMQNFIHSTQFTQYVSARVLLCSRPRVRECFICDTIAALPELIHRCQTQHMLSLSSYTVLRHTSKLLPLNVLLRDDGPVQGGPLQNAKTTDGLKFATCSCIGV